MRPAVDVHGYGTTFGSSFLQTVMGFFQASRPPSAGPMIIYINENLDDFTRLLNGSANFIGLDNPDSYDTEIAQNSLTGFPIMAAGIVPIINLGPYPSELSGTEFILTTEELVGIFNHSIANLCNATKYNPKWNHYLCQANLTTKSFHRTSPSGTNYVFSRALSRFSKDWATTYGYGLVNKWPADSNVNNGSLIESNEAMLFALTQVWGSIGYLPFPTFRASPPLPNGIVPVTIAKRLDSSMTFVKADRQGVQAVVSKLEVTDPTKWHYDLSTVECDTCWPITGFSYLVFRKDYPRGLGIYQHPSDVAALITFFTYLIPYLQSNPAAFDDLDYAFPPTSILNKALLRVNGLRYGGQTVSLQPFRWNLLAAALLGAATTIACTLRIVIPLLRKPSRSTRRRRETRDDLTEDRTKNSLMQQIYDEDPTVTSSKQPRYEDTLRRAFIDTNEIVIQEQIGKGAFGEVYVGTYIGAVVAIKRIMLPTSSERMEVVETFVKEAGLMASIRHPNIVQFLGASVNPPYLYLVTEYCAQGSLHDVLHGRNKRTLTPAQKRAILIDAALGIMYLHGKGIVHRDIKTQNLLVDRVGTVKVADFGTSAALSGNDLRASGSEKSMKTMVGTPEYVAPEVVSPKGTGYSAKADIYSFAIVLWEVWSGQEPYSDKALIDIIFGVTTEGLRPPIDKIDEPVLADLIQRCWDADPDARPTFDDILATLRELDDEANM